VAVHQIQMCWSSAITTVPSPAQYLRRDDALVADTSVIGYPVLLGYFLGDGYTCKNPERIRRMKSKKLIISDHRVI